MIDYRHVQSSNIESIGYDAGSSTLGVRFLNGGEYEYANVPESEHRALMSASSHGQYFNAHIKDRYRFRKVR